MIKNRGGVFGRNPTFNDVAVEGDLSLAGSLIINGETITGLDFEGSWDADTNTPTIVSGTGVTGQFYIVSVAGTTTIDGISSWDVGDWIIFDGLVWQRVEGGADGNFVELSFTGTATGPTYETSNAVTGLTITDNAISADGTDADIDIQINPKGTGGVGIGGDTSGVVAGVTVISKFCVKSQGAGPVGGFVHANDTSAITGSGVFACRSRGTLTAPTVVQDDDRLASLFFAGHDGTDLALAAEIGIEVDGTPGSDDMPGRIIFKTTPDGSQIPAEAMRINSSQEVIAAVALSSPAYRLAASGIITEAGTSRTLTAGDNGKVIYCTSGSAVTITCDTGLGAGFSVTIVQGGAGKVTVAAGTATLNSYSALFSTMGQYAVISLISPVADEFIAAGNLGV
jgi:hypothetical protein